ncbi:hypothetical protein Syun_027019 [Stephania yunnanensis]|uniref:AP-5 complex subunit zeta-1 C-terminal TPR domain-containing protein n=1 Tax=Stephania yunnanensis TaxID=152371 RepID=A0AAP0EM64_9MAGN
MDRERDWEFYLRSLSLSARESSSSNDPTASDPSLLQSGLSADEQAVSEDSCVAVAVAQFESSLADPVVAAATLDFLNANKIKIISSFPTLLPEFFPLLLKLIAWNGEKLERPVLKIFPGLVSTGSFLPMFPSLVDLPILVVALEKVERSSGSLIGSSIASIQKSAAPEMLIQLMDESYTGSTIEDIGVDSEIEGSDSIDVSDSLFLDLLKDEHDGLAERHWTSPGMAAALQSLIKTPLSERLRQALLVTPRLLDVYFSIALHEVNNSLICALIPLLMSRYDTLFPDRIFSYEVRRRLLGFTLAAFHRSPDFIALLKKPIIDRLGEAYDSSAKTELALQLCWAIGEHGGGGGSHKDIARELFESLELLLYENLSSSRLGLSQESSVISGDAAFRKSSQARLLCFVITAIAKLATFHRELLPRARVSLAKVARSRNSDMRVWRRARDYLGLMNEPALCMSVLGPSSGHQGSPGTVNWAVGGSKMIAHVPFYILNDQEADRIDARLIIKPKKRAWEQRASDSLEAA